MMPIGSVSGVRHRLFTFQRLGRMMRMDEGKHTDISEGFITLRVDVLFLRQ